VTCGCSMACTCT